MLVSKYKQEYVVKSYETDCHGFLRIAALMNILQDAADASATMLGLGFEECMNKGVAWVGSNYLIKIKRWPKMHEKIFIATWPAQAKLWGAIRDFVLTDEQGEEIIWASSQWVLIDMQRRRPVLLSKYFPQYEALQERVLDVDFKKAGAFLRTDEKYEYGVRFDDMDINHHVNNAVYPLWASESVQADWRKTHIVRQIELWYEKEALFGNTVDVVTCYENDKTVHSIRAHNLEDELCRCEIWWQKL